VLLSVNKFGFTTIYKTNDKGKQIAAGPAKFKELPNAELLVFQTVNVERYLNFYNKN
jgi:hypothetical protein